jgi:SAM-dependent methyltransferase
MLAGLLGSDARVVGIDLSLPHLHAARRPRDVSLLQADAAQLCFRDGTFDLIWSCNTINHLADPVAALQAMRAALRPAGRVVLAQSGFLPEMYFAWDSPLDEAVRSACHEYYRERYGLRLEDTAGIRALVGLLQRSGLRVGRVHTIVIERVQPLSDADRGYFEEAIFRDTWGERLRPFLTDAQWQALRRNTDPASQAYCLDRADFHHIQTLTVCMGHA